MSVAVEAEEIAPEYVVISFGYIQIAVVGIDCQTKRGLYFCSVGDKVLIYNSVSQAVENLNPLLATLVVVAIHICQIVVYNHFKRM